MLSDEELMKLEKKYFDILKDLFSRSLGEVISQIYSQEAIITPSITAKTNTIEKSIENIIEGIIYSKLSWRVCSLPVSSDSCFEVGDAIINIDAKSVKNTDNDATGNKVNLQRSQTSYITGTQVPFSGRGHSRTWEPKLKFYETHKMYGEIPNLTYVFKVIYSDSNLVEKIILLSIPHGQLNSIFGHDIVQKGKESYTGNSELSNIRFLCSIITSKPHQIWREEILYNRK